MNPRYPTGQEFVHWAERMYLHGPDERYGAVSSALAVVFYLRNLRSWAEWAIRDHMARWSSAYAPDDRAAIEVATDERLDRLRVQWEPRRLATLRPRPLTLASVSDLPDDWRQVVTTMPADLQRHALDVARVLCPLEGVELALYGREVRRLAGAGQGFGIAAATGKRRSWVNLALDAFEARGILAPGCDLHVFEVIPPALATRRAAARVAARAAEQAEREARAQRAAELRSGFRLV